MDRFSLDTSKSDESTGPVSTSISSSSRSVAAIVECSVSIEVTSTGSERYIPSGSLERLSKHELVELYNKYIIPLPQRKYRVNRRGQAMSKKQIIASKKRKLSTAEPVQGQPEEKRKSTGKLITSFDLPLAAGGERLKPPPSCVSFEKKKIKLNTSSNTKDSSLPSLDKLKINKDLGVAKLSPKKIKLTNGSSSTVEETNSVKSESLSENDSRSTSPMDCSTDEPSEKKKKIKKISWP